MQTINPSFLLTLLENSPSFVVIIDKNQSIYWLNQSFCDFLGLEREQLIGRSASDVSEPCLKQALAANDRIQVFAGVLNKWIELQDVMEINGSKSEEEPEQPLTVCYYTDASSKIQVEKQLMQLESTLTHKMSHDPVTGMLNHHSMIQTFNSEVSRSRRYNNPLSLILMNVDYHPGTDSIAHEKQEQMRLMISQLLKDQMRWADIVGHIKGFDFVLLLPETTYEAAETLIKKLNNNLKQAAMDNINISYGISQWQKGDDVQLFLGRAADDMNTEAIN